MMTQAAIAIDSAKGIDPSALRNVPLFADFEDGALDELARLFTVQSFRKHQTIFREGDPGEKFYVVVSGSVAVVRDAGEGRETCSTRRYAPPESER